MPNPHLKLTSEVKYLKGVGPTRAELLAARGIHTVEDLLYYTPFRYEDRTRVTAISDLVPGQTATILANVLTCGLTRTRNGTYIYDLAAIDASGARNARMIRCIWFNARYLERNKVFHSGQKVFFYGKAEPDFYGTSNLQIVRPQFEIIPESEAGESESLEVGRMVPIYESVGQLGPRVLRRLIRTALESVGDQLPELLPASVRKKNSLVSRTSAFRLTHFPDGDQPFEELARFSDPAPDSIDF